MAKGKLIALLQRHGDTVANEDGIFRSRLDPPLNSKGISQAEKAGKNIAKHNKGFVKRIITSPMLRAVQTGDIIAEELGVKVEQDRGLISWHLGFMSGKDRKSFQDILDFYIDNPKKVIPEGESLDNLETRTEDFFDKELRTEGTLFVTHNSNIVTLENLFEGNKDGRPEASEASVEPGGTLGIYVDENGKYYTEILFGVEKEAQFTS
jgi:broad specificity phosphatase PhoE